MGLNPLVIPNGIPRSLLGIADNRRADEFRKKIPGDVLLCKVARWDPDKRWIDAVETTAKLKSMGLKTTLLARGGREPYGGEVINRALSLGLTVSPAEADTQNPQDYLTPLVKAYPADIIEIRYQLPLDFLSIMYRASDAVLANSSHEPFGIVGLEAMAAGGIVFTGSTGEDYSIPFVNSFMIETSDPLEMVSYIMYLHSYPQQVERMRLAAQETARNFTWEAAALNLIGKLENQARIQGTLDNRFHISTSRQVPAKLVAAERTRDMPGEAVSLEELRNSRCLS
jgi:glycosyltransferase involved in cell wall biosynthesis